MVLTGRFCAVLKKLSGICTCNSSLHLLQFAIVFKSTIYSCDCSTYLKIVRNNRTTTQKRSREFILNASRGSKCPENPSDMIRTTLTCEVEQHRSVLKIVPQNTVESTDYAIYCERGPVSRLPISQPHRLWNSFETAMNYFQRNNCQTRIERNI